MTKVPPPVCLVVGCLLLLLFLRDWQLVVTKSDLLKVGV